MTDPEQTGLAPSEHDAVQQLLEACQGDLQVKETQIDNLKIALTSSRRIGAAIGILMAQRGITDDDAFTLLSQRSQDTHRKLRDIAERLVLTGSLDG